MPSETRLSDYAQQRLAPGGARRLRERFLRPLRVGFDIDGTLIMSGLQGAEFDDEALVRRNSSARVQVAHRLRASNVDPVFISGRTERVRSVTVQQLQAWPFRVERPEVHLQRAWRGWDALRTYKARRLKETGCQAYVGDEEAIDHAAAKLAGVPFLHVDRFERHGLLPLRLELREAP